MNHIQFKNHVTRVCLFCVAVCMIASFSYASTPMSQGDNFAIEQYVINEGTGWMFGSITDVKRSNVGEGIVSIVMSSNPDPPFYALFQGFLYLKLFEPLPGDYQYDISEILAEEFVAGESIFETEWQNDTDPYFYWSLKVEGLEVLGYSVAFNEYPDEFVDVVDASYQTPDMYLVDGKHAFYVIAKNTDGNFGNSGSFQVWVDTGRPEISSTVPENGGTVNDVRPEIKAILFDATSGIKEPSIQFTITTDLDEYIVSGTYDSGTGEVSYTPDEDYPEGLVTVRLEISDQAGNTAVPAFWSFTIDTTEPEGWLLINGDAPVTDTPDVVLDFSATEIITEVTEMIISNDGIFDVEEWEPYLEEKENWLLPYIAGTRTVYVKFRDAGLNESDVYYDSIILVMEVPNTFITDSPQSLTPDLNASFAFTSTVTGSQFQFKIDDGSWSTFAEDLSAFFESLPEGNHYFQVRAGLDLDNNGDIDEDEIDPSPAGVSWTIGSLTTVPFEPKQPIRYYKKE